MFRAFVPAILCVALASCGAADHANREPSGGGTVDNATLTQLSLNSDFFQNGQPIPVQYTCDGVDQTPTLRWSDPPADTKSFALVVDDPDAPNGTFHHWGVFDIPATTRSIGGDQRIGTEVTNDFGTRGYGGPCPPKGHGPHHYHFKLYALDRTTDLQPRASKQQLLDAMKGRVLAEARLVGVYKR
jgi:Raf kinase inhibitor-like YbhB/YbcL family protein